MGVPLNTPFKGVSHLPDVSVSLDCRDMTCARTEEIMTRRRGPRKALPIAAALALVLGTAACSGNPEEPESTRSATEPTQSTPTSTRTPEPTGPAEETEDGIVGTTVHFTAGDILLAITIEEDNPATRFFVAMLPMTLEFSDYGGKEKVATPTGEWDFTDAEGLNPQVGDLFSYMPWGNLGFFYNADGNTFDSSLTKIGETQDIDQIELLDGQQVTIDIAG